MPGGSHILVVDDEAIITLGLQLCLQREGFQVTTAKHGLEALERWRQHPVDAVVTDLRMPQMPGHELAACLRQAEPELPIIVVSAYLCTKDEQFLRDTVAGPLAVLMKPVDIRELLQLLRSMLTSERSLVPPH